MAAYCIPDSSNHEVLQLSLQLFTAMETIIVICNYLTTYIRSAAFMANFLERYNDSYSSLASHTIRRERKGLVMLQLLSCHRGTQLLNMAVR